MDIMTTSHSSMLKRTTCFTFISTTFITMFITALLLGPASSFAWGRRGHALVAETAAYLLSEGSSSRAFLKSRAFDLGYYANIPDLVWKVPQTYQTEWTEHFMDLEIFARHMKATKIPKPFALSRSEFEASFPSVPADAGRALWRVRELFERLQGFAKELHKADLKRERRHQLQAEWLLTAGVLSHYVADLAQPLHVTENYDGQLSGQNGVHAFFEGVIVDEFPPGTLESEVANEARRLNASFKTHAAGKGVVELLQKLIERSNHELAGLLKIDKRVGRNKQKARKAHRNLLVQRMAQGSLHVAELWSRAMDWPYDGNKFFTFISTPEYVRPGSASTTVSTTSTPSAATPSPSPSSP